MIYLDSLNASEDSIFWLDPKGLSYEFWLKNGRDWKLRDATEGAAASAARSNAKAAARRASLAAR